MTNTRKNLIIVTMAICSSSCCWMKSITMAPSIGLNPAQPNAISASGTVKIEFGEYCPSKKEKELILRLKSKSENRLDQYFANKITKERYLSDQKLIQASIEAIVSAGRGEKLSQPAAIRTIEAVASAPGKVISSVATTTNNVINSATQQREQRVVKPAADLNVTPGRRNKAISDAEQLAYK